MIVNTTVAAATAVVGYDIAKDKNWVRKSFARVIVGIGCCGSAVAGDTEFELIIQGISFGLFRNLALSWPTKDHIIATAIPVPANAQMELKMTVAATTNPINVVLQLLP